MISDFKKFIMRGNVLDLAVAVIIGGAFGKIVASLVNDIIMPILGVFVGTNFSALKYVIEEAQGDIPEVAVYYGQFIQNIIDFVIIAFVIFLMVRFVTNLRKKPEPEPAAPPEPSAEVQLLTEIRDLLKKE